MRRKILALLVIFLCFLVLKSTSDISETPDLNVSKYYLNHGVADISSPNIVTSIYLFYRYYDTLFEALMLLFSVTGIIALSVHHGGEDDE